MNKARRERSEIRPKCYEVELGESKRIKYPDSAFAEGGSTCLLVGIVNKKMKIGYLAHFTNWTNEFGKLLDQAISDADNKPGDITLSICGNVPFENSVVEQYKFRKRMILDTVKRKKIPPKNFTHKLPTKVLEGDFKMTVDTVSSSIKVRFATNQEKHE